MNYTHVHAQTVNSDRFLERLFCTHSFTSLLRFSSLNALLTLPVEKDCIGKAKPCARGDIILLNESIRFIQNVASCYALCLTNESVNTATLVHAPACVCATHGGLSDTSALEIRSRGWSGFNSLPVRSPDFEKRWAIPLSAC